MTLSYLDIVHDIEGKPSILIYDLRRFVFDPSSNWLSSISNILYTISRKKHQVVAYDI
jgi:hypothetical protein